MSAPSGRRDRSVVPGDAVLVTGARGDLGAYLAGALRHAGYRVVAFDRREPAEPSPDGVRAVVGDVTDRKQVDAAAAGCRAVVHCAAIPHADEQRGEEVFDINTVGTLTVLRAAAAAGASRAVVCSSASALGLAWNPRDTSPLYVPIDEEHPLLPADHYGLSKQVVEQIAAMTHRRDGLGVAALRFPWVGFANRLAEHVRRVNADPGVPEAVRDLWSYVLPEDIALAVLACLSIDELGLQVLNVFAPDTLVDLPTEDLVRRYHPTTELRAPIPGAQPAWSTERLQHVLAVTPQTSWRDVLAPT